MSAGKSGALNAICPYFTMFPLSFPQSIISEYHVPGVAILDPFCGRGTTLYAARKSHIFSAGIDNSPVATSIAEAKLVNTTPEKIVRVARGILSSSIVPEVPKGEFWEYAFDKDVLKDICTLRQSLLHNCSTPDRKALRAIILGALHGPLSKNGTSYFSNQCPRTYAPKPNYAVKFWKAHHMHPPQVDTLGIISSRAQRYFLNEDTIGEGVILRGDSRKPSTFAKVSRRLEKADKRIGLIITSPPYYGMNTYIPDQWLRNWFVGGPATVDYSTVTQISHKSTSTFSQDLRKVWKRCSSFAVPNAILAIRFGAINDRAIDPEELIKNSLSKTPWRILSIHGAGIPSPKSRQANTFMPENQQKSQIEEIDVIAILDKSRKD